MVKSPKGKKTKEPVIKGDVKETKKLTAAQRIAQLEQIVAGYEDRFAIIGDEIDTLRGLVATLARRLNASIEATESQDTVKDIIMDQNVQELQGKVDFLIAQGVLEKGDDTEIADKTFIVGREIDSTGKVINPRIQFSFGTVLPDYQEKIKGMKVGDVILPDEGDEAGLSIEITEVYKMVDPNIEKNFEGEGDQAEA